MCEKSKDNKKRPCDFECEVAGALCLFDRLALVAWNFVYSCFVFIYHWGLAPAIDFWGKIWWLRGK